jgi:hypothetical protein
MVSFVAASRCLGGYRTTRRHTSRVDDAHQRVGPGLVASLITRTHGTWCSTSSAGRQPRTRRRISHKDHKAHKRSWSQALRTAFVLMVSFVAASRCLGGYRTTRRQTSRVDDAHQRVGPGLVASLIIRTHGTWCSTSSAGRQPRTRRRVSHKGPQSTQRSRFRALRKAFVPMVSFVAESRCLGGYRTTRRHTSRVDDAHQRVGPGLVASLITRTHGNLVFDVICRASVTHTRTGQPQSHKHTKDPGLRRSERPSCSWCPLWLNPGASAATVPRVDTHPGWTMRTGASVQALL